MEPVGLESEEGDIELSGCKDDESEEDEEMVSPVRAVSKSGSKRRSGRTPGRSAAKSA